MNSPLGILLFILLIVLTLAIVSIINRIQTKKKLTRIKAQKLKSRVTELESMNIALASVMETTGVQKLIAEETIDLLKSIIQLDPSSSFILDSNIESAQSTLQMCETGQRILPIDRAQDSDAAIARQKYYIQEAAKITRRHHEIGLLHKPVMETLIQELSWANLMVEVISFITHGYHAVNNGKQLQAYKYYQKAQDLLSNSHHTDVRRMQLFDEITQIIKGKRIGISKEIMPETDFTPTKALNLGGTQNS